MAEIAPRTDAAASALEARNELERLLDPHPELATSLPLGYLDRAQDFVRLLLEANQRLNLTRLVAPADVARLHLLDSLAALSLLDEREAGAVIDLGSGGGLPAIPLALARPDTEWVMVDSVRKKAAILRAFVDALGLRNARVVDERAEAIGRAPGHRERYAAATARACAPLPVLVELALPLVRPGGRLLAWKGPLGEADDELRRGRAAAGQLGAGRAQVVGTGLPALGGHTFVVVPKQRSTPARYPRRPGEPSRRPLG